MLNSQQIIAYLPLDKGLRYPGNASIMNKELIKIVTFDIVDLGIVEDKMYYLPEVDPFNLNF